MPVSVRRGLRFNRRSEPEKLGVEAIMRKLLGTGTDGKINALGYYLAEPWAVSLNATAITNPTVFTLGAVWSSPGSTCTTPGPNEIREVAVNNTHTVAQTLANAVGPVQSLTLRSVAPVGGRQWLALRLNPGGMAYFDVINGVCGGVTGATSVIAPGTLGAGYDVTIYPQAVATAGSTYTIYCAAGDGTVGYMGDVNKGLTVQRAEIVQSSVATWINLLADIALRDYGNRFDLDNSATKAIQPVWDLIAWNGRPGLRFSGANLLAADAMAAQFAGDDLPMTYAEMGYTTSSAAQSALIALASNPLTARTMLYQAAGSYNLRMNRTDNTGAGGVDTASVVAGGPSRHSILWDHTGQAVSLYVDAATTAVAGSASNVGTMSNLSTLTVGARRGAATDSYETGIKRAILISRTSVSSSAAVALLRLLEAHAPR